MARSGVKFKGLSAARVRTKRVGNSTVMGTKNMMRVREEDYLENHS